ncbi:hypothetical protein IV203_015503 [Nitzschia inconspicua]|uniref:Uncharacterized protein n=1 Tax=Nitzschia inconspicua TaxID=303405 RepID=A0A9K3LBZ7_9STRA|nr:hypothetical protein IV203_015503 [Nitzschia inconspicua]
MPRWVDSAALPLQGFAKGQSGGFVSHGKKIPYSGPSGGFIFKGSRVAVEMTTRRRKLRIQDCWMASQPIAVLASVREIGHTSDYLGGEGTGSFNDA